VGAGSLEEGVHRTTPATNQMVALLIAHVEVDAAGVPRSDNEAFYTSLGAAICPSPEPDDALVVNCGLTQLWLRSPSAPSSEAASLLAEALGGSKPTAEALGGSKPTAAPRSLFGHLELWTLEPLEVVVARLAAVAGAEDPQLLEGADARIVCSCPGGTRLIVRRSPEGLRLPATLPGGPGQLGAVSRVVLGVRRGAAAGVRAFFVSVLGSACDLKQAGGAAVAYAVAYLGSGQQIIFEERDDERCPPLVASADGRMRPAPRKLAVYVQSREAFRAAFLACAAAGTLAAPSAGWDAAERGGAFVARAQCPPAMAPAGGAGGAGGACDEVATGIELELRSIAHAACPAGIGRRPGSGRMPGGFGAASLARARGSAAGSAAAEEAESGRAPRRPPKSPGGGSSAGRGGGAARGGSGGATANGSRPQHARPAAPAASPTAARAGSRQASPRRSPRGGGSRSPPATPERGGASSFVRGNQKL
jgi:hypothetical protein